jgi:hypothetical protein
MAPTQEALGLVPHWVKDPAKTRRPIDARAETLATSPMFREALARRRDRRHGRRLRPPPVTRTKDRDAC